MPDAPPAETLFVRLYFDRHIKKQLAIDLRERGFDVLLTEESGLDTAPDEDQLAFATKENRAILTFNIRDFAPLHEQWIAATATSPCKLPPNASMPASLFPSNSAAASMACCWLACYGCLISSPRTRCATTWFI